MIKRVDIPTSVAKAFEDVRTSEIQIQTKENEVRQREAEARAIDALGLTGQEYDILKAIESGKITFWVLDGESGITITGPDTGTGVERPGADHARRRPRRPRPRRLPAAVAADDGRSPTSSCSSPTSNGSISSATPAADISGHRTSTASPVAG